MKNSPFYNSQNIREKKKKLNIMNSALAQIQQQPNESCVKRRNVINK